MSMILILLPRYVSLLQSLSTDVNSDSEMCQDHYTQDEALALPTLQKLRLAASASESPYGDNNNDKYPGGYTKQEILDELPKDAIIYSGNSSPGRTPGSIPRGILTDRDYCHSSNPWRALPPPSAADLFSPRPLPDLSWGRRPMNPPQKRSNHRKRVGEEDPGMLSKTRGRFVAE